MKRALADAALFVLLFGSPVWACWLVGVTS